MAGVGKVDACLPGRSFKDSFSRRKTGYFPVELTGCGQQRHRQSRPTSHEVFVELPTASLDLLLLIVKDLLGR